MNELPSGWTTASIRQLCKLENGRAFKPTEWTKHGLPIVRIQNLNRQGASFNHFAGEADERYRLRGGELLFAWSGTPGTSFGAHVWRGGDAVLNQHIFRVDFDESIVEKRFFRHAINQKLGELIDVAHGGVGLRHVTKGVFENTEVLVPPLSEQKRIADKLDALLARVEACRERLDRVPGILKRFRQSVLAAATSGELTREWREERGIQGEWREAALGSLLTDVRYGTSKKCAYEPSKTPVIRIPNVAGGTVNHDDMKYADFDEGEIAKLALAPGDLLMIRSNGSVGLVGRTALVSEREAGFLYAGYLIRLRPNVSQASPAYLSLFLASPASRARIELTARSTTGVNNINAEEIRVFPVALPPVDEQHEIVRRVGELFAMADRHDGRLSSARAAVERATPSALAKAFRGELVPQDPNDESASTLLEQLRTRPASTGTTGKARRGGARGSRKTAKVDTNMLTRKDVTPTHLTTILKERGSLTAEALWTASQLEIDDFYDQLKDEEARGLLRENRGEAVNAPRLLEPAA